MYCVQVFILKNISIVKLTTSVAICQSLCFGTRSKLSVIPVTKTETVSEHNDCLAERRSAPLMQK